MTMGPDVDRAPLLVAPRACAEAGATRGGAWSAVYRLGRRRATAYARVASIAAAIALGALLLAGCQAASAGTPPPAGPGDGDADAPDAPDAPAITNTIAYVRAVETGHDEIRLVAPDGSGDRLFWRYTGGESGLQSRIGSLAWRPDGRELAFTSSHEDACSWYASDVFTIRSDGAGVRRATNPPDCAGLTGLPTGRVTVGVQNYSFSSGLFQVYVQGSTTLEQIVLGPGSGGVVTFPSVVDFGPGLQPAVAILGGYRWIGGAAADVQAGGTVAAGTLEIGGTGHWGMGAGNVVWHEGGTRLGYVFAECAGLYGIARDAPNGSVGSELLGASGGGVHPCTMAWGPTAATAEQILYVTSGIDDDGGVYLTTEGGGPGSRIVETMEFGYGESIGDVAWLPDGSGLLFSGFLFPEVDPWDYDFAGNVYRYDFASDTVERLTDFTTGWVHAIAVSPDGRHVVFEFDHEIASGDPFELWIAPLDGGAAWLLVEDASSPAWSR